MVNPEVLSRPGRQEVTLRVLAIIGELVFLALARDAMVLLASDGASVALLIGAGILGFLCIRRWRFEQAGLEGPDESRNL